MGKNTMEMNEAIDNFVIRMAEEDKNTKKKSFEECSIEEYFDYLESLFKFLGEE
jgi:hypothetical protein